MQGPVDSPSAFGLAAILLDWPWRIAQKASDNIIRQRRAAAGARIRQSKISKVEINSRLDAELVEIGFKPLVGPGTPYVVKVLQEIPIGVQSA